MQTQTAAVLHFEVVRDQKYANEWRVEAIDTKTGDVFVAIFSGPLAQERAKEYASFKNSSWN